MHTHASFYFTQTHLCRAHAFLWVSNQQALDEVLSLAADQRPRIVVELVRAVLRVEKKGQKKRTNNT